MHLQIQETSRSLFQKESKRVSDLYEQHGYGHFYESSLSCGGAVFADETKSEYYHSRTGHRKRYFDKDFFFGYEDIQTSVSVIKQKVHPVSFFLSLELLNAPSLSPPHLKNYYLRTAHEVGIQRNCTFARTLDCLCVRVRVCVCVCVLVCVCVFGCQMLRTRRHLLFLFPFFKF